MRIRALLVTGIVAIGLITGAIGVPAKADTKFEGTVLAPNPAGGDIREAVFAEQACASPDTGGELNGINYTWVDLGKNSTFTKFQFDGPKDLFREPDPTGAVGGPFGDHDLDYYAYDAKCKDLTTWKNVGESKVKGSTKRPARYVMVIYWSGIHADVPFTIVAS